MGSIDPICPPLVIGWYTAMQGGQDGACLPGPKASRWNETVVQNHSQAPCAIVGDLPRHPPIPSIVATLPFLITLVLA